MFSSPLPKGENDSVATGVVLTITHLKIYKNEKYYTLAFARLTD
ncbi:MAG: hypothetical protein ACJAWN_002810 [Neolewinella sp.]